MGLSVRLNSVEEKSEVLVAKSCLTFCNPMDCSLPVSSFLGISQTRILEWVAIPFSKGSSQPRDWIWVSCIAEQTLYHLSQQRSHQYQSLFPCCLVTRSCWTLLGPTPGECPDSGIESRSLAFLALAGGFFTWATREAR